MKNIKKGRMLFLLTIVICICAVFVLRLFQLQIVNGASYYDKSVNTIVTTSTIKAPRGSILDRYCIPLVQDVNMLAVTINKIFAKNLNAEIHTLIGIFNASDDSYIDTFPLKYSEDNGYYYDDTYASENIHKNIEKFLKNKKIDITLPASDTASALVKYYKLEEYSNVDAAKIMAVRYEIEQRGVKNICTFAENISMRTATVIKEHNSDLNCVDIIELPTRVYSFENNCSHIIGNIGRIYPDEYEDFKAKGYQLDDIVGKAGIEKKYESYLKGTNGTKSTSSDSSGSIIDVITSQEAVAGNDVILTLDANMQLIVENSLKSLIANTRQLNGSDSAKSASVVFMDPNNGDVLAMANYPTYNLSTFYEDYPTLSKDTQSSPYVNRAIAGLYPPGSTFKMVTATAALEAGSIVSKTEFKCTGRYMFYDDYRPTCFNSKVHGNVTVVDALQKSCNCFFCDASRLTGVKTLDKYASLYGFGAKTGIELTGELDGIIAGPEYRQSVNGTWNSGDTLLVGIGQSDTLVTPLQLAVYASVLANGGTRYVPHIINSVRSSDTGAVVEKSIPEGTALGISDFTMNLVHSGMYACANAEGGSAYSSFKNYTITNVCAKTGTAEYANKLPTTVLIGYAPADNPQIAFAVIVENSGTGTTAYNAALVKDVLNYYFANSKYATNTADNSILG